MAVNCLCQPLASVGSASNGLVVIRGRDLSSRGTHPVSAMVSCAHMKHESERLCSKAGLKTQADNLVSQFWSVGSRRGLLVKMNCPSVAMPRLGSRLVVVRSQGSHFGSHPAVHEFLHVG